MDRIKVLLADDHPLVRSGISKLLEGEEDILVVGEAADGEEAVTKAEQFTPDVVVIDLSMPKLSGLEATKVIREKFPRMQVLILTIHENEEYVYQILKSGAGGYVLKTANKEELVRAIRAVARGEKFFSPGVLEIMTVGYLDKAKERDAGGASGDINLTNREREILSMIGQGLNTIQIANKLFISPRTVDTHRSNIMEKLEIHDVANLVRYAIEHGFVPPRK
jgi:two-component system response regulator NreC